MNSVYIKQMLLFGIIGVIGMIIDFSITWLCKEKFKINKYLANSLGFILAVLNNFLLNKYFNYPINNTSIEFMFVKFSLFALIGLALNNLIIYLLEKRFKENFYLLKLLAIAIVFFWNFLMNTFFTFK